MDILGYRNVLGIKEGAKVDKESWAAFLRYLKDRGLKDVQTEMGTLSLWCRSLASDHRWQLQFQLRDSEPQSAVREEIVLEEMVVSAASQALLEAFGGSDKNQLAAVVKTIAAAVDLPREQWPLRLLRRLADLLFDRMAVLSQSPELAARWMNLLGFCLRPGFGDALDAERLKRLWKIQNAGPVFPQQPQVQIEWYVMWRRLLLEQLSPGKSRPQHLWSLARLGARELLYGSNDRVIPPDEAGRWIEVLLARTWPQPRAVGAALAQLARKTGDRTRDVAPAVQARVLAWMEPHADLSDQRRYLETVVPIAQQEEQTLFGESLPVGLILHGRGEEASNS